MNAYKILAPFFLLLFVSQSLWAQKNISVQQHGWYMYFGNHKLSEKFSLHTEYQWRRDEVISKLGQSLARVGIDYKPSGSVMITGGYAYAVTFPYGDQPIPNKFHEHRIWEQLILNHSANLFYFQHRFRLEQRFLENVINNGNGTTSGDGYTYRNRARYRFLVNVPLNAKTMSKGTWFLSAYDEVFLQFGPNFGINYLDQNRLYGALGYMFLPNANAQLGYLNQYVIKGNGIDAENSHTLQVSLTYNFDFTSQKK